MVALRLHQITVTSVGSTDLTIREFGGDCRGLAMGLVGKLRPRVASRGANGFMSHDRSLRPAILIQIVRPIFFALKPPAHIFPFVGSLCFEPLSRTANG
jgi:hypothetical protein